MPSRIIAYHGTTPDAPLFGGQDPVSSRRLEVLWVSDSYDLAAQFQDGQIRKFAIRLSNPAVVSDEDRETIWNRQGHAAIVDRILAAVRRGEAAYDGVIFPDTIDGMEFGDVIAVFPLENEQGDLSLDHAVELLGLRTYDEELEDWVSDAGFAAAGGDALPEP